MVQGAMRRCRMCKRQIPTTLPLCSTCKKVKEYHGRVQDYHADRFARRFGMGGK
jgi:hypothetical protein